MTSLRHRTHEVEQALQFIEAKWHALRANARDGHHDEFSSWRRLAATSPDGHLDDLDPSNPYILYLPNDFISPGGRFMVQFYWDSYFIVLSLLRSGKFELAKGMVENCLFLIKRHGMVIANRKRWAAGSQLPFLSQMVREIYVARRDLNWLRTAVVVVKRELEHYWMNGDHLAWGGLSRYHAPSCYPTEHLAKITMDHEATWDLSPRFEEQDVLSLLPVDLNCNLYTYEADMAFFSRELGDHAGEQEWIDRADRRRAQLNSVHWDETDGLYYDFDFQSGKRKHVKSLATFFPLFYGIAVDEQQDRVTSSLCAFEHNFGLATCDEAYGYSDRQWNFPVGWPPLHLIVYRALLRSGKEAAAVRVAIKWLTLNLDIWIRTRRFFEKYDVVAGSPEVLTDRYQNQEGFGWTNAVFHLLVEDLREVGAV